ncbi:MAG: hypothetical protein M1480_16600, partial [Bacteroidetes bacterium]|nr:hypothetical protein [Bacteroidota bacterium]
LRLTEKDKQLLARHKTLKLQIELVPSSCWFSNTRKNVKQSEWDRIRKSVYAKANYLCEICGGKGTRHPVECHEVWIYNDNNLTQTLGSFQAICPLCHEVKHIGLAGILGNGDRALNRFKKVNRLSKETAEKIVSVVFKEWKLRSGQKWELNINLLKEFGIDINNLKSKGKLNKYRFVKIKSKINKQSQAANPRLSPTASSNRS